jgi:UDP-glucose 4-epimerase
MLLVVGKNSFLAKEFIGKTKDISLRAISHAEIDNLKVFQDITCIVNFSFSPLLYLQDYDRELDVDARLARIASDQDIHYVMLSTRKVYQETIQWGAREDAHVTGSSIYGKNKLRIEEDLTKVLGSGLTILRPGNVFGYERQPERIRFGAYLLNQLADTGVIRLTVSPFVRRDVIPVDYFCEVLREVVLRRPGGVINIGAGESLEIGRIALWIIEGFGSGRLIVEAPVECDEFQLDTERLKSEFGLNCGREQIADFSRQLGRRLRRDMKQGVE